MKHTPTPQLPEDEMMRQYEELVRGRPSLAGPLPARDDEPFVQPLPFQPVHTATAYSVAELVRLQFGNAKLG